MRKVRHREVKKLVHDHTASTASRWWRWDLNPCGWFHKSRISCGGREEESRIWNFPFESVGEGPRNPMICQVWKPRTMFPNSLIKISRELFKCRDS